MIGYWPATADATIFMIPLSVYNTMLQTHFYRNSKIEEAHRCTVK